MDFTDYYNDLKNNPNNMSNWLPAIIDCGLNIPKTMVFQVPEAVLQACFMEGEYQDNFNTVYNWVVDEVMPKLKANYLTGLIFVKNGAFSNKYDFKSCAVRYNPLEIANSVIEINYASLTLDTGGNTEFIVRERIPYDDSKTATIYNGMPLRVEYRLFYDFDNHRAKYIVNYWDWDYCHNAISRNLSDRIIYEHEYPALKESFESNKEEMVKYLHSHLKNVTGLTGIWSVDVMVDDKGLPWVIDMAQGHRSAYWDPKRDDYG